MSTNERIQQAIELAKAGKFYEAQIILLNCNADEYAWRQFGKYWSPTTSNPMGDVR